MKNRIKVLLIIPAYNEEENIERVTEIVTCYAEKQSAFLLDYIVINDGSTDNTEQICREKGIRSIHLSQNLGIGGAVQTGYLFAKKKGYDIAVQFDGDGQHDIASLEALITPIMGEQADFVVGSRFIQGKSGFQSTFMRRLGIRLLSMIIRLFARVKITDPTSGFRAANKKAIEFLARNYPVDYPEPESIVELSKNAFHIAEVQVNMFERMGGTSSISPWKSVYYMYKVSLAIICTSFQRRTSK
jgi:glycosyltransferase involved in cell wall biosynthesis